jgi:hypothetical protein
MRKVLLSLACWLSIGLASSQAAVEYKYVADQSTYAGNVGSLVTVNLFLQETVTGSSQSLIFKEGGLFGAATVVTRVNTGNATIFGSSLVSNDFKIAPNTAASPVGFGPTPTIVSQAPANNSQSGLIVNADVPGNGADGPKFSSGGPGVRTVLLGTLNITVGSKSTTFVVADYGPTNATVTQQGTDLDATSPTHQGAADPVGGYFSFRVVNAIPEPSSMALCGLISCGIGYAGYRRRKNNPVKSTEAQVV